MDTLGTINDEVNFYLYKTDGTTAGTTQIEDLRVSPNTVYAVPSSSSVGNHALFVLYSARYGGGQGDEQLWSTDGTIFGTNMLFDFGTQNPSLTYHVNINSGVLSNIQFFFNGNTLWRSDGTAFGSRSLDDVTSSGTAEAPSLVAIHGKPYFIVADAQGQGHLWTSDGTAVGTHEVNVLAAPLPGVGDVSAVAANGKIYAFGQINNGVGNLYAGNPGNGSWTLIQSGVLAQNTTSLATGGLPAPGDVTGDGTSDVVWINSATGDTGYWSMNGSAAQWQGTGTASTTVRAAGVGDFNGEGTADVLWLNPTNNLVGTWLMNNGQPSWQLIDVGSTTMNIAGTGDFNGDGTSDILWLNPTNNLVGEWQMSNAHATWALIGQGSTTMNIAGIGDFNGDGNSDILWLNPTNNLVGYWAMNGTVAAWSLIGQGSTTMNIAGIGDFNGDGTSDVLWRNNANGLVGEWLMNNGLPTWNLITIPATNVQIAGTGDYNGDGTSDILWRNPTTGDVTMWTMNDGQATLSAVGGTTTAYHPVM